MTPEEAVQCGLGHGVHYWKIMADKGYIGNPNDTHPLERVCPHKGRLTEPQACLEWTIRSRAGGCGTVFRSTIQALGSTQHHMDIR